MGLPVVACGISETYAEQVLRLMRVMRSNGVLRDPKNYVVEDFGLPVNVMLACSVKIAGSAEEALAALAQLFASHEARSKLH